MLGMDHGTKHKFKAYTHDELVELHVDEVSCAPMGKDGNIRWDAETRLGLDYVMSARVGVYDGYVRPTASGGMILRGHVTFHYNNQTAPPLTHVADKPPVVDGPVDLCEHERATTIGAGSGSVVPKIVPLDVLQPPAARKVDLGDGDDKFLRAGWSKPEGWDSLTTEDLTELAAHCQYVAKIWTEWLKARFGREIVLSAEDVAQLQILITLSPFGVATDSSVHLTMAGWWLDAIAALPEKGRNR
jgi:hypothetical protein